MTHHGKTRTQFILVLLLGLVAGVIAYPQITWFPASVTWIEDHFKVNLGLDLQGGIHLEYKADVSQVPDGKVGEALSAAEAVIERRVNAFGVGEPLVQQSSVGTDHFIIVELPGVKDIEQAKKTIKETPLLEFREEAGPEAAAQLATYNDSNKQQADAVLKRALAGDDFATLANANSADPGSKDSGGDLGFTTKGKFVEVFDTVLFDGNFKSGTVWPELVESQYGYHIIKKIEEKGEGDTREVRGAHVLFLKYALEQFPDLQYKATGLTGKNLKSASVSYQGQGVGSPQVALQFDDEGTNLFADLTKRNVGKQIAILIDGAIVTAPTVQTEILNGQAVITGNYTISAANALVKRLNEGALPVPISLESQQSIDASLGAEALRQSLSAGLMGLAAVAVFMIFYYRFLGFVSVVALVFYSAMLLSIFKLSAYTPFSITLSLSGIAGFILSIGMAVDANVLIFERTREELAYGKNIWKAIDEGFRRAWPSIRDGNYSTLITTFILIGMGTGFVKGFALILTIGVLLSMFTAVVLVRVALRFLIGHWAEKRPWILLPKGKIFEKD
ncbi:MAG: protein translocase subunit SecD [Candidatus Moranbacteria bacterium]|jgi:protein-export membrane protein SecD|nr:protein translocase subunit SecD [Candidatus Moranbacteria bacterium]